MPCEETKRANLALSYVKISVKNFYSSLEVVRKARQAAGAPTDGEQDLVRAALVFAAGGLDIVVKELIRDSLRTLAAHDKDVQSGFESFAQRKLKSNPDITSKADPSKFLAQILVSSSPYDTLIDSYIYDLTGSSLQSTDELFKAAAALDIDDKILKTNKTQLSDAFTARNHIVHELDINFVGGVGKRQRKSRTKVNLKKHSDLLILVASNFIAQVEKKLSKHA